MMLLRLWSEYLLESATGVTGALSLGTIRTPWRVCKTMGLGFGTNCKATTAQVVTHGDTHSSLVGAQSCGANSQVSVKQPQLGSLAKLIQYDSVWYSGSPWFSSSEFETPNGNTWLSGQVAWPLTVDRQWPIIRGQLHLAVAWTEGKGKLLQCNGNKRIQTDILLMRNIGCFKPFTSHETVLLLWHFFWWTGDNACL